jgi:hypothetical protein
MTGNLERISREELRAVIKQFGGVQKFAQAVPVKSRTVWYWLAGREIHPAMEARIRSLDPFTPPTPNRKEHP